MRSVQKHHPRQLPISVIRRYLVSGKVQGVYFRHSTRALAERLGLHRGPELALVDAVRETELGAEAGVQVPSAFEVL